MTATLWMLLGLLAWLAVIAILLAGLRAWASLDRSIVNPPTASDRAEDDAAMDSVRAALTECEPKTRRVRAGGG